MWYKYKCQIEFNDSLLRVVPSSRASHARHDLWLVRTMHHVLSHKNCHRAGIERKKKKHECIFAFRKQQDTTTEAEDAWEFRMREKKTRDCYQYGRENEYEKHECVSM